MHCVLFRIPPGTTREAVIEKLLTDKRVLIAQPLNEFESATAASPAFDDPYARLQSNVNALDVAEAHNISRGSGHPRGHHRHRRRHRASRSRRPHAAHAQLHRRRRRRVSQRPARHAGGRPDRRAANNGIGIVGVAPDVRLLAYKACWQASPTSAGRCNSFTLAQALADALAARAQVINLSLVGPSDPLLEALVAKAIEAGVIVVGAVSDDPRFGFPARLPRVLPVAEAETVIAGTRRHPARPGARHRHAGAQRTLRFRFGQLARHRADHRRGRAAAGAQPETRRRHACARCSSSPPRGTTRRAAHFSRSMPARRWRRWCVERFAADPSAAARLRAAVTSGYGAGRASRASPPRPTTPRCRWRPACAPSGRRPAADARWCRA